MTSTPADTEPHRPTVDGTLAPTRPGRPFARAQMTRAQKCLVFVVVTVVMSGVLFIAGLGFAGSYSAVTVKAEELGFGWFASWITIGVDSGIGVFLALDLLLTWLRMPYPPLRPMAWVLTGATIAFNASAAWPNPLGVAMHSVIPLLFITAVEAARHAVGRLADITADKHIEGPPASRWLLNPLGTFVLWRRQRLWLIREWATVLDLERERRIYVAQLRRLYGRAWRRKATADQMLVLALAKDCMRIADAVRLAATTEQTLAAARAEVPVSATQQTAAPAVAPAGSATPTPATLPAATPATATPTATGSATPAATRSATSGVAGSATPATATPTATRSATPAAATGSATDATEDATTRSATDATDDGATDVDYEPGTPQYLIKALWLNKGGRPTEGDITTALRDAGLPNSRAQAGKIRRQVASENKSLPGLRAA